MLRTRDRNMFFKRKRRYSRKRTYRKSYRRKRTGTNRRLGVAKPGYVRNYRRAAIAGKARRVTGKKLAKTVPSKRFITYQSVDTFTNGAGTTDRTQVFMPMGHTSQSVTNASGRWDYQSNFRGEKIYLTGIKLNMFLASTQNEDYYIRIMCFWCTADMDLYNVMVGTGDPTAAFVSTASLGNNTTNKNDMPLRPLDVPYGLAGGYPDWVLMTSRPNPLYPGKLLYDKVHKITLTGYNPVAATTNPTKFLKLWFPFNKEFEWNSYCFGDDAAQSVNPLANTPNYGKFGQPVFFLTYMNAEVLSGFTQRAFDMSMESRVYFRDV